MKYALYYPDEGQYSVLLTLREARQLKKAMYGTFACIVNIATGEVVE
jgi:hypothetical protein